MPALAGKFPQWPYVVTSWTSSVDATPDVAMPSIAMPSIEASISSKDAVQYFDSLKKNGTGSKDINAANLRKGYKAVRQVKSPCTSWINSTNCRTVR
ncbi:MAG: hypothetical protein GPOALKHO_001891 [Sodalis sp.]|nr:MAG: hypothetical protein GPOALKHO_001891 [Sodalis sp.]